jgi:hypothetical protein
MVRVRRLLSPGGHSFVLYLALAIIRYSNPARVPIVLEISRGANPRI